MGLLDDIFGKPTSRKAEWSGVDEDSCVDCEYFEINHEDIFGNYCNYSYCKKKKMKVDSGQRICSSFIRER